VKTFHTSAEIGAVTYVDEETGLLLDCPEDADGYRKHWLAKFKSKNDATYKVTVGSIHLVPSECLIEGDAAKDEIVRRWSAKIARNVEGMGGSTADALVIGGDFNFQRCQPPTDNPDEYGDCNGPNATTGTERNWWETMKGDLADPTDPRPDPAIFHDFRDAIWVKHCVDPDQCTDRLQGQYRDGDDESGPRHRTKRIDFFWVGGPSRIVAASHDLSCGIGGDGVQQNCHVENTERYADHRLVWSIVN
ncbi:MAG: hypothetical protein ACRD1T_17830, partial [Acidimicrobiia bacterium]